LNLLLIAAISLGVIAPPQVVYAEEKPVIALVAPYVETVFTPELPVESLEEMADRIAIEHKIATSTLRNLVWSESRWDIKADNGFDRGLVQINRKSWPDITDEMAFDPEFSLNWAAEKVASGEEYRFVVCSCWALVKTKIPTLPRMKDIVPNSEIQVGSVAVFQYPIKHVAYVKEVYDTYFIVTESNYTPCLYQDRRVENVDKSLVGFWKVI
jgi:hypothetical protein